MLVCHDGQEWLPSVLSALRHSTIRPRHVLAIDTGSTDDTPRLLAEAESADDAVLDGVHTLSASTGFAAAVAKAVELATERWGDPGAWLWLLHDDSAPEPDCLDTLLRAAESSPKAAVLGPLALDWTDPRLIVEAGLSTDASGHRRAAGAWHTRDELPEQSAEQTTETLAVPSAGSLIDRATWEELGGFDREIALLREDVDFGWRVNNTGRFVLSVPWARLRHARAASTGVRAADAVPRAAGGPVAADRAYGLRTFLVNCGALSFVLGVPRLALLCLLRAIGFAVVRNGDRAHAELLAVGSVLGNVGRFRAARRERERHGIVRGLFTSRFARIRAALRGGVVHLVSRQVAEEAALGRLPDGSDGSDGRGAADAASAWLPRDSRDERDRSFGPDALPAGVRRTVGARRAGLRRPGAAEVVAVPVPEPDVAEARPSPGDTAERDLLFVEVSRRRVLAATVFSPPAVLFVVLTALALVLGRARLGFDLAGGALLPVGELGEVWSTYLDAWHPVTGGTGSAAPVALGVLGLFGAPFGGPAVLVALLLIGDAPLAALTAYAATRRLRVGRWVRACVAAAYGLLPVATASVAQGRLDVVVVHLLLPVLVASIVAVLTRADERWLSTSVLCALTLAAVGAFSPLVLGLGLAALVVGYVVLPPPGRRVGGGVPAMAIVVLLPLALLLPWLPTLFGHPELLLRGVGAAADAAPTTVGLVGLDPGGDGAVPFGLAVVLAAVVATIVRPTARVLFGLVLVALGVGAVVLVRLVEVGDGPGYQGVPLLVASAGLLSVVLATRVRTGDGQSRGRGPAALTRLGAVGGVALVLVLAAGGAVTAHEGSVRADGDRALAPSLTAELAETGRSALVLGDGGEPTRQTGGRLPRYGDDALVPVAGAAERLQAWRNGLLAGSREAATSAAAAGVLFVVLPQGEDGARLRASAADLVAGAPATTDGRVVLRLTPSSGAVAVVAPEQARRAVSGEAPSGELMSGNAVAAVRAELPEVRVRISEGSEGRLLVLAAEQEPGWVATVDGERVPIVPAWGHQVAVSAPASQADVTVEYSSALHNILLLGQVAALLFAALTAIPARRRWSD